MIRLSSASARIQRELRVGNQRPVGYGEVVGVDVLLPLEFQCRHLWPPDCNVAADHTKVLTQCVKRYRSLALLAVLLSVGPAPIQPTSRTSSVLG